MHTLSDSIVEEYIEKLEPTGSRVICNPPPTDTDEDWMVLLKPNISLKFFQQQMEFEGFDSSNMETYDVDESLFLSLRKEEENLIVTNNEEFYNNMMLATAVAKNLNLLEKKDRITLFNAIVRKQPPKKHILDGWFDGEFSTTTVNPWATLPLTTIQANATNPV